MNAALPAPPVPADADLTHYDDMPLEVRRLRDSGIAGETNAEVFRCAVLLWCVAWHQIPAGSLPTQDVELCRLVGLGRDMRTWRKVKAGALRGWRLFSDGRLYHPVVTEKVLAGWNGTIINRWGKECERIRKENKAREKKKEEALEFPQRPSPITHEWPPESDWNSASVPPERPPVPPENALNRIEGNGMDVIEEAAAPSASPREAAADGPQAAMAERATQDVAFAGWRALSKTHGWPDGQFITSTQRYKLQAILAVCGGLPGWKAALVKAATGADYLKTTDGKWQRWFHFDWMIDIDNFRKLMEGRYDQRHQATAQGSSLDTVRHLADLVSEPADGS